MQRNAEISRCRAPLHRSTTHAVRHAADVELYSSTTLQLYSSTALYTLIHLLYTLPQRLGTWGGLTSIIVILEHLECGHQPHAQDRGAKKRPS